VKASRWLNDHWDVIEPLLQRFHPELHGLWRGEFGEINRALLPLIEYIERAERDNVAQQAFFCMKRNVIAAWKALAPNPYAAPLVEMIDQRFDTTADGARCEAACWLTRAIGRTLVWCCTLAEGRATCPLRSEIRFGTSASHTLA
jgi:hypothetical protein